MLREIADQFPCGVDTLRRIGKSQHGLLPIAKRVSDETLASFPKFTRDAKGRWGIFQSQLDAYWKERNPMLEQVNEERKPNVARDQFLYLPEIAPQFGKSVAHLRKIGEAQHGMFKRRPFSLACLESYPHFQTGAGGKWGIFESQLREYWDQLRSKNANIDTDGRRRFRSR